MSFTWPQVSTSLLAATPRRRPPPCRRTFPRSLAASAVGSWVCRRGRQRRWSDSVRSLAFWRMERMRMEKMRMESPEISGWIGWGWRNSAVWRCDFEVKALVVYSLQLQMFQVRTSWTWRPWGRWLKLDHISQWQSMQGGSRGWECGVIWQNGCHIWRIWKAESASDVVERCKRMQKNSVQCSVHCCALLRIAAHRACCGFQTGSFAKVTQMNANDTMTELVLGLTMNRVTFGTLRPCRRQSSSDHQWRVFMASSRRSVANLIHNVTTHFGCHA